MLDRSHLVRALFNGVAVVISILLAFAIDAAWDSRTDRLAEAAAMDGIREELEANLIEMDRLMSEYQQADTRLREFFTAAVPESEEEANKAVRLLVGGLLVGDLLDPSTGTLEMLLNSGNFGLLSKPEFRASLWIWKTQLEDLEDETAIVVGNVQYNRRLLGRLGARGLNHALRPSRQEQFRQLRASQDLSAQAQTVLVDRGTYQRELAALRSTTAELLEMLN